MKIQMPSRWQVGKLGENCQIKGRIGWRGYKTSDLREVGPVVLGGSNVRSRYFLDTADLKHLSKKKFNESPDIILKDGDVLVVTRGNGLADVGYFDGQIGEATINPSLVILSDFHGDSRYLFYYLASPQGRKSLLTLRSGSSIPAIYQNSLRELNYLAPPIHEQTAIVYILLPFDQKIEANRRMNATLEATARALFKSWFVDFDPVHAKARGEQPAGMDDATAALFPDHFEDSELGPIPAGWRIESIGEHVRAIKGLSYKGDFLVDSIENGVPMHNLNSINEWGTYKFDGIKFYSGEYQARHEIKPGDLIVANTEQGFDLLLIASPAIVPATFGQTGIISHHVYKVEIRRKSPLTRLFLYYRIMMSPFRDLLQGYTNGTTVNMLPADAFERPQFVMPPAELMQRFDEVIEPMLEQIERNYEQSRTLAETRDALLPRLVSGELRVGETEA